MLDPPQTKPTARFPSVTAASTMPGWYPALLTSVSGHVTTGHRRTVAAADAELLAAYWSIDRDILEQQHEQGYRTKVIARQHRRDRGRTGDDLEGWILLLFSGW